ncbi:MAE_28990/MAE_18760 family HEPN-like nuclease [Amycolatopsis sp. PS_44_ISF1]|uniref:MAE_28990/MAE_18760 family HEPN-like nuclease n=1 Tax=Amycolatopsis sp. PS_44_ISF1 TaxID=2974917 RepID=UPI0028DFE583|nr:MAE_28990/MAE_18760 family HEPN-like nuclease [Amycolatopsis sp. PS_44_ISF1]MDT8909612.1 MAE_28990/MAE_18760 family HEPN-like nuclease [Amycolatopsis sp. PS_44_ISF1]
MRITANSNQVSAVSVIESTTESFKEFIESIQEVRVLLNADRKPATTLPEPGRMHDRRSLENALCRASMLMLVAHYEGFVKSILTEFIDEIAKAKPPSRRLPDALLELYTKERIQEIARLEESTERVTRTRKLFTGYAALWDRDRSIDPTLLPARILARQFTNAGPDSLRRVLDLIGQFESLEKIQRHVCASPEYFKINIPDKLKEITEKRNKIAHGDLEEKPTSPEVSKHLEFLIKIAYAVDQLVRERIDYSCSLR